MSAALWLGKSPFLATSSADNSAKVWDIVSGKEIFSSPPDQKYMTDVAFSADGKTMALGSWGKIILLDVAEVLKNKQGK